MTRWIHGISKEILRAAFCEYFGVSDEHADIVVLLFERPGESVTTRKMQALLNSHRPPKRSTVYERIRVLREIMAPESLNSGGQLDDTGYSLTEVGFEECRQALVATAEVLMRHGPEIHAAGLSAESIGRWREPTPLVPGAARPRLRTVAKAAE